MQKSSTRIVSIPGGSVQIGTSRLAMIAGPCSIESEAHLSETAAGVQQAGARILRGGIFKMRTNPEAFQGIGKGAFDFINRVKSAYDMPLISEITDPRQVEELSSVIDCFQVGSRNMYNYELLKELGRQAKPVMLKRSFAATIDEWVKAAEYIEKGGNLNVILCERGIRTFETKTRNSLDLNAVAYLKINTHYPVIVDPSHGTGRVDLIPPMSLAAIAAGADGLMIEVHPRPSEALSDGFQALTIDQFTKLMGELRLVARAVGREV